MIRNGTYVYIRARATNKVRFYENGVERPVRGIVVEPLSRNGEPHDYIEVPAESAISAQAAEIAIRRKIEEHGG